MRAVRPENNRHAQRLAVMCLGGAGELLFATSEAKDLCERWNRELPDGSDEHLELRVPEGIVQLSRLRHVRTLRHPCLPELALTLCPSALHSSGCCQQCLVVCFDEARAPPLMGMLSPRERCVAELVVQGLRNDEIADRLHRSRRTVEYQLNSIYRKLDINSRSQLVLMFYAR